MARTLLVQLDGALPNLALMRLAAMARSRGDEVVFRRWHKLDQIHQELWFTPDHVYASAIFERSAPLVKQLRLYFPRAVIGGTGSGSDHTVEEHGATDAVDYAIYPAFTASIGFSQRGCRLKCPFCVVPKKEGAVAAVGRVDEIWRGEPYPRHLLLLDNDFFGQPAWREQVDAMKRGGFKVNLTQGINARLLTPDTAAALASIDYRDSSFKTKRLYTAWDNKGDEGRLFRGLQMLTDAGVSPDHIMVYMLIGYWPGETHLDRDHRRARLRQFGARPYPMPYVRTPELVGFQRWVIGAYDKRVSWADWERARYEPRRLTGENDPEAIPESGAQVDLFMSGAA